MLSPVEPQRYPPLPLLTYTAEGHGGKAVNATNGPATLGIGLQE